MHALTVAVANAGGTLHAGIRGSSDVMVAIASTVLIALGGLAFALVARRLSHRQQDDDGDSGSGGGGGRRRPTPPPGPRGDPVWWPEFERQFAAYVREDAVARSRPLSRARN